MPSYPFSISSTVDRTEYWPVFGDVNGSEPLAGAQCVGCTLHGVKILIGQSQFVLAGFADEQVLFDFLQIGVRRQSESVGF